MGASVLQTTDRALPLAGAGEMRVRIVRPGAGVVDALGEGVRGLEPGDRVWVWDAGPAQEYVVLPRRRVVRMNDDVPFEVGAALGVPALTAHRCLTRAAGGPARLEPGALTGRTVLVAEEAGAVGAAAIRLAEWAGATVSTTAGSTADLVVAAGAVADYREEDVAAVAEAVNSGAFHRTVVTEVSVP